MSEAEAKKITILVADDHMIVRRGIVSLLSLNSDVEVVGEATDGRKAVDLAAELEPDIVLMDISMPELNGLEATRQIKSRLPGIRVLVLTAYDNVEYVLQILQSGANGYLLKNTAPEDLYTAIREVHAGRAFFSPTISKIILDSYLQKVQAPVEGAEAPVAAAQGPLTSREREILQLIAEGKTHQQIGDILHISARTVDTHRNNIMKKLDLHETASLVTYAITHGILILPR